MQAAPTPAAYQAEGELGGFVSKWIKIWVVLLAVVTLVAVVYLIAIVRVLSSINGNLAVAQDAVVSVGGDTKTLPRQVDSVNRSLGGIDEDVKPIQTNAQKIVASLQSIQGKLVNIDRSLVDSSGVLRTVLSGATDTRTTLEQGQALGSGGTNLIWRQVGGSPGSLGGDATVNVQLDDIRGDTRNAISSLQSTNRSLIGICNSATLSPFPPMTC
jgi:hypothetical protein